MNEANVLGQRTRKVNIDYGLAARVNAEVAEDNRRIALEARKPKSAPGITPEIQPPGINERNVRYMMDPWNDTHSLKAQNKWAVHFRNSLSPFIMMSSGDFYAIAKQASHDLYKGSGQQRLDASIMKEGLLQSIAATEPRNGSYRDDIPLLFSTRVKYNYHLANRHEILITHHYFSPFSPHRKQYVVDIIIANLANPSLFELSKSNAGLIMMQAFFNTKDDADTIRHNLEFITGFGATGIYLRTLPMKLRKEYPETVLGLNLSPDASRNYTSIEFKDHRPSTTGMSRGVIIEEGGSK